MFDLQHFIYFEFGSIVTYFAPPIFIFPVKGRLSGSPLLVVTYIMV